MVFKMKGFSGFGNSPAKKNDNEKGDMTAKPKTIEEVDLTKKKGLGPRATKKPFDRKKFEEENKIIHDVEAKMDEYPPKYFHMDIKKKNK
jgi:hypothetical protein